MPNPPTPLLHRVSLTGADDRTNLDDLVALGDEFPAVEWALLYVPHNEGAVRNPSKQWRDAFVGASMSGYKAIHLCGGLAFEQLLQGKLPSDVYLVDRIQLNVNPNKRTFTDDQVVEIYHKSLTLGPDIILQRHKDTVDPINRFLTELATKDKHRVHVLLDDSKGRGVFPDNWEIPAEFSEYFCGVAGGMNPTNVSSVIQQIEPLGVNYWIDMESGIRTDNQFDLHKAREVLVIANLYTFRT